MSIRTKILVTVATVATMTAIGTTKAYGLENTSVSNIEKTQVSINENDENKSKTKDVVTKNVVENKTNEKKEALDENKKDKIKDTDKIQKEKFCDENEKELNSEKQLQKDNVNKKENKGALKTDKTQEKLHIKENKSKKENLNNIEIKKQSIKEEKKQVNEKQEAVVEKKEVRQPIYKGLEVNNDVNLKLKEVKKENNITQGKVINVVSKVNVREKASLDSIVIGELSLGENIKIDKSHSNEDWYGVCFGEHGGFVSVKYIEIEKPNNKDKEIVKVEEVNKQPVFNNLIDNNKNNIVEGEVISILSKLNVRESASLNSVIIGQLSSGEKIKVDKNHSNKEWYGICFGEHGGFVSTKYVKLSKVINDDKHEDKKDEHKEVAKDESSKKDENKEVSKDDAPKKDENKEVSKDKEQSKFVLGEVINVASHLNVREKPTTTCEVIGKIYEGNQVLINKDKSKNGWYEIAFGSNGGYVSADYIRIIKKDYLITDGLVKFVASYEGYSATAYRGADYQNRTIGYGHVIMPGETYNYLTEPEARNLLKSDLNVTAIQVKKVLNSKEIKLNTYQFDSLVSFAYNCGVQGLSNSRLLRDIKNKADLEEIKDAFLAWRHCNGIELEGLRRRRVEEFEMYSTGDYIRDLI